MKKFYTKSALAGCLVIAGNFILPQLSNAQSFTNNNGAKINIATGTYMKVVGTFENQTSGAIQNNGSIMVSGDWTNNDGSGVFTSSTGIVYLDGAAQNINGTQPTLFNNLTLAGTGNKTMQIPTTVGGITSGGTGVLALADKTLILGTSSDANDLTVNNPANTAITYTTGGIKSETTPVTTLSGSAGPGYSKIDWKIGASGSGTTYTVPFTTGATFIPFIYEKTTAGAGAGSSMRFSTYPTADDNTPWATTVNHVANDAGIANDLSVIDRFWNIEHIGYSTLPHSKYTFTWDPADITGNTGIFPTNGAELRPQRFNPFYTFPPSGSGAWGDWLYGPDNINTTTHTLQITIANDYTGGNQGGDYLPVWTLVDESNPLPIELIRFTAECQSGQVAVSWTTASETNNDFFTVQRSADGTTFEDVTVVDGAGNSNSILNYSAIDYSPYGGTSYYRLKQTDLDGTSKYSDVVAVSCADAVTDFNLINAYDQDNGNMAVTFNAADNELYAITLFDARGRQITQTTGRAYSGKNQVSIPVGDLARGIYLVNLSNEFKSFGRRVMLH